MKSHSYFHQCQRARCLAGGLILLTAAITLPLHFRRPPVTPQTAAADLPPLPTQVEELKRSDFTPVITSEGTVSASDTINVTAQVGGTVKRIAPGFEVSGFVPAGEIVVELDSTDYEAGIVAARALVARAQSALALEETRSSQARLNWEELGYQDKPGDLVLRLPQLSEAKAALESASSQLMRAERDLERTKIRVPFACRVLTRNLAPGQTVSAGAVLGSIAAADRAWVKLPVRIEDAQLLSLPETSADKPLPVELRMTEDGAARMARIIRTEPQVDAETGSLLVTAAIDFPYRSANSLPPLRIGQKVTATIRGAGFKDVTALPRAAVASGNLIHLVTRKTCRLVRRTIKPLWSDDETIITRDLPEDVFLATGAPLALESVPDGTAVRITEEVKPIY